MGLRRSSLVVFAGLLAIGLFAASPFLCNRLVGTGEAFNYSLSSADAVVQMREGIVPPLAGQTIYAFNGRIHPLRNAPYLHYLAAGIDLVTLRRLSFWEIQNVSLVLSFVAAVLACYGALRRATDCPRLPALLLSAAYGLSPALLGAAYSYDLFMTVHAAVFVPLALAACVRGALHPSFSADAGLAACLAATWLAHPPVAMWLTFAVFLGRTAFFLYRPSWIAVGRGIGAVLLGAVLSVFVFISVRALETSTDILTGEAAWKAIPDEILQGIVGAFPAALQPVGRQANGLGDLQFGYVAWGLLLSIPVFLVLGKRAENPLDRRKGILAWILAGTSAVLLALTLPVPHFTAWVWHHVPVAVLELTNIWPMQRLYLVALPFTLFGAALALPWHRLTGDVKNGYTETALVAFALWTLFEAQPFISRGYGDRRGIDETRALYQPSNLDLTITSYSFIGAPSTFVNGVIDPQFEFRLLRGGAVEAASNMASAAELSPVVARGALNPAEHPTVVLKPGKRYLLSVDFKAKPMKGDLELVGPGVHRVYALPSAGNPKGFGMLEGQRRSIPLWTDGKDPETVELRTIAPEFDAQPEESADFAGYTLRQVDLASLPIRLESLVPMRFTVEAPDLGMTVETPRRFVAGYSASVNGLRVTPLRSPDGQVMVPIPRGRSTVVLTYEGPVAVRLAFWVTVFGWAAFAVWRLFGSPSPRVLGAPIGSVLWRHRTFFLAGLAVAAGAGGYAYLHRHALPPKLTKAGPLRIQFTLPYGQTGVAQPLLTTGHISAGSIIFVTCIDDRHVRVSADVWGSLYESVPIEVDFSQPHWLTVSDSALMPAKDPALLLVSHEEASHLRGELRIELDGHTVIRRTCSAYEAGPGELFIGSAPFGSNTVAAFLGEIQDARRLAIPRTLTLPAGQHARMRLRFPKGRAGTSEALLSVASGSKARTVFATYLPSGAIRISSCGAGGSELQTAEVSCDAESEHELDFEVGETNDRTLRLEVGCLLEGQRLFGGSGIHPAGIPPVLNSGIGLYGAPGVEERFTGPLMDFFPVADVPKLITQEGGTEHIVVSLPADRLGRREPLLTTGHAGAGDLVYLVYEDTNHVRVGYDHWGVVGTLSESLPIDYSEAHEFWITSRALGPIFPGRTSDPLIVSVDGQTVLRSTQTPFPSLFSEVTVAANRIGASTADPAFSGRLEFAERVQKPPAPR